MRFGRQWSDLASSPVVTYSNLRWVWGTSSGLCQRGFIPVRDAPEWSLIRLRRVSPRSSTRTPMFTVRLSKTLALPKDFFDAAVGNIPFGNYPVFDPAYRRTPQLTRGIHDYFLAKSLDVVRPGGLIALITSRYTMDKQDSTVRCHLADGAVLLGALRLPNTAFRANAGTDVTTDILFLQKRSAGKQQDGERWTELAPIDTPDGTLQINEYFVRHPEMMLGRMGLESAQYGAAPALIGSLEPEILANAISRLPAAIYTSAERQTPAPWCR